MTYVQARARRPLPPDREKGPIRMRSFLSAVTALLLCAAPAAAQSERPRPAALVNFGYQGQNQDFSQSATFPLYGENGAFEAAHALEGAPFFEIGASVGILRNFSVGGSYVKRSTKSREVPFAALVPSPLSPGAFRTVTGTSADHEHKENAFHVQAIWHVPITVEFDISVFGGPSFFSAEHDLLDTSTIGITELAGNQANVNVAKTTQSESAVGFNVGVEGRYMFTRWVGAGATLRFSRASSDFTAGADTIKIDMGGPEIAGGIRFRF